MDFLVNPATGFAPLSVQFINQTVTDSAIFTWDFGDGSSSSETNPQHTYVTPGIYTVNLMASNPAGSGVKVMPGMINVRSGTPPTADFVGAPITGFAPLTVIFGDTSTGGVNGWSWEFGDGSTGMVKAPVHDYTIPGTYTVKLTVTSEEGSGVEEKAGFISVLEGEGVTPAFTSEPATGNAPFTANFADHSSGAVSGWNWDFGDGSTSTEQNPSHTYATSESFEVSLVVMDESGDASELASGSDIGVQDGVGPTAGFTMDVGPVDFESIAVFDALDGRVAGPQGSFATTQIDEEDTLVALTVSFKDSSSSPTADIAGYEWDFGDGTKSGQKDPVHTFIGTRDAVFTVTMTVQDSKGVDSVTKPSFISMADGVEIKQEEEAEPTATPTSPVSECEGGGAPSSMSVSPNPLVIGRSGRAVVRMRVMQEKAGIFGTRETGCAMDVSVECVNGCENMTIGTKSPRTNRFGVARTGVTVKRRRGATGGLLGKGQIVITAGGVSYDIPVLFGR